MPDLEIGSYKIILAPQFEPGFRIEASPMRHPDYGPIAGFVAFTANYRIRIEEVDKSHAAPIWMPSSSWEIGFHQVIEAAECRIYRKKFVTKRAEKPGYVRASSGILGLNTSRSTPHLQFEKTRVYSNTPHIDCAQRGDNRPWYGNGPLAFGSWDFPQLMQHERTARLEVTIVPSVINKNDPLICGLKQEQMILSTYLIFMDRQRRHGWTLRHWRWSANFAYYKDPLTGKEKFSGPGIAMMEQEKRHIVNQRGLPEVSSVDGVSAAEAFQNLRENVAPAVVSNAHVDMGLDLPWV